MADKQLLSAYLMVGEDELKREFLVDRLTKRVAALGDLDFNKDMFVGSATNADELIAACNTLPFMSECRLVMVKDLDKAPKAAQEALVSYLTDPCETTVLACTAAKLAKNTRLYKAFAKIDKKAVVSCEPKSKRDLPAQVQDLARSNSVEIVPNAAVELIAMIGESTVHLNTELKKLAAALGRGHKITVDDLHKYVTRTSEVKPWELTDALCDRDARKCALLLSRMADPSPFGLLTMCVNRLRELLIAKDLHGNQTALAAELRLPDWRVRNHGRWASRFTQKELEQALISAADLEREMKSGADQQVAFERWVLQICAGR